MESSRDATLPSPELPVETVFHLVEEGNSFILPCDYFKSLAKRNFLVINEHSYSHSHDSFKAIQFDDIFINSREKYELDPAGVDAFVEKHLRDPKTTRLLYWSDGDIKTFARLTDKYGFPGEQASEAMILLDKFKTKGYLKQAGVKCAEFYHYSKVKEEDIDFLINEIEAKHKGEYPLFGKPTTLNQSRGTAIIKNREELINYLRYSATHPELEFMIETFLDGIHGGYEAVIIDGKIAYDMADYYPSTFREANYGKPAMFVQLPFDSEIYKKSMEAMVKLLGVLPYCQNTNFWYEFVFMKGDVYILEASKRVSSMNSRLNWECRAMDIYEIFAKLRVGRRDFYVAPPKTVKIPTFVVIYFAQEGTVTKQNDLPKLECKIANEIVKLRVGDFTPPYGPEDWRLTCYELYLQNNDASVIEKDVKIMLNWVPFEYSASK